MGSNKIRTKIKTQEEGKYSFTPTLMRMEETRVLISHNLHNFSRCCSIILRYIKLDMSHLTKSVATHQNANPRAKE